MASSLSYGPDVAMDRKVRLHHSRSKVKGTFPKSLLCSNVNRARQAVEGGQFRKALQSVASVAIAQVTEDVVKEMLEKHPCSNPPHVPSDPAPPPFQVTEGDVMRALRSFPNGTAPGHLVLSYTS